ncbi:MAG: hypothetical protein QOI09_2461, partial [Chloroflexota bacterium]|nr:hypothetical protein [Chloroflexota bacterium]
MKTTRFSVPTGTQRGFTDLTLLCSRFVEGSGDGLL